MGLVLVTVGLAALWRAPDARSAVPADLRVMIGGQTKARARTLVLVHGNFDRLETWDRLRPLLEADFRVVTLDLPGFGASPNPRSAYGVDACAAALAEALKAHRIDHAVFVGNSLGGAVVAAFAAAHPERVDALVLEDANLVPEPPTPEMAKAIATLWVAAGRAAKPTPIPADMSVAQDFRDALEAALRLALRTPGVVDAALVAHFAPAFDAAHWPELAKHAGAFSLDGLIDRLVAAHAARPFPVLVLWGVDDPYVPVRAAERLMPRLRGARAVFFAGAGHAPHLERPLAVAEVLVAVFGGAKITLPAEDLMVPAADTSLPEVVSFDLPRVEAARLRALFADHEHRCATTRDAATCAALGRMWRTGRGTMPNAKAALEVERRACAGGDAGACLAVRVPPLPVAPQLEAARLHGKGCEGGDPADCRLLAALVLAGHARRPDGTSDQARAFELLGRACQAEDAEACTMLAGWNKSLAPADVARLFQRACALGDPEGCEAAALGADGGRGAIRDAQAAESLYARACALRGASTCAAVAELRGRPERARAWFAANRSLCRGPGPSPDARTALTCLVVGEGYLNGVSGKPDPARAAQIFRRDCDVATGTALAKAAQRLPTQATGTALAKAPQRLPAQACGALAPLLAAGRGVPKDVAAALRIDRALCDGDDADACLRAGLALAPTDPEASRAALAKAARIPRTALGLARVLLLGAPGLPRDAARANQLLQMACPGGEGEACVMREER